jgi:hypothetical protein
MVWDDILPGEQESAKRIITDEKTGKKNFHDSWGKCLRTGFRTPVEGKRDRWGV